MRARLKGLGAALVVATACAGALASLLGPEAEQPAPPALAARSVAAGVAAASSHAAPAQARPAPESLASEPQPSPGGTVVCAASGQPIPGARVAIRRPGEALLASLTCGPDGAFQLPPLPAEPLELVAAAPGWLCSPLRAISHDSLGLRVALEPGRTVRGRVVCADGSPLPAGVSLRVADTQPGYVAPDEPTVLDSQGGFSLTGLPPGNLSLAAECVGWFGAVASGPVEAFEREPPYLVLHKQPLAAPPKQEVTPGQRATLRVRLYGPQRRPLANATVTAASHTGHVSEGRSGPAGRLDLEVDAGGLLLVTAAAPGLAAERVRVHSGRSSRPLEIHLQALIPVATGRFLGPGGEPLAGALAFDPQPPDRHAHAAERVPFEAALDREGRPTLEGLPDGVWVVSVPEPAEAELRAWVRQIDTAQEADLSLELSSAERGRLGGRVVAPTGQDSIRVELRPTSLTGGFRFVAARHADESGAFAFDAVPAGEYRLQAFWQDGSSQVEQVDVRPHASSWATLTPGPDSH